MAEGDRRRVWGPGGGGIDLRAGRVQDLVGAPGGGEEAGRGQREALLDLSVRGIHRACPDGKLESMPKPPPIRYRSVN